MEKQIAIRLVERPNGLPSPNIWHVDRSDGPTPPKDGEVLVQLDYISLDPAMRGWIEDRPSYLPPVNIGEVMRAGGVGRVLESTSDELKAGDHVTGLFGVQRFATAPAGMVTKIDTSRVPAEAYVSELGVPGMTAYFGLLDVGKPAPGETVLVSSAAGAVGSLVGQIAKAKGCTVIGLAGTEAKASYLRHELGFDVTLKYDMPNIACQIQEAAPGGVDVYFDNVGGDTLEAAIGAVRPHGRIVSCGMISIYNDTAPRPGPRNLGQFIVNRLSMKGFVVIDYYHRQEEFMADMVRWIASGDIRTKYDIVEGVENFAEAILKLFNGGNFGKLLIRA